MRYGHTGRGSPPLAQAETQPNPTQPNPTPPLSQMGLDRGPPPPRTAIPWGKCYLDGAVLPLLDQEEEIGFASHSLQESLASEQRGGGHIRVLFGVPLSTSGQESGVSAPRRTTMYVWDGPSGLSMVFTVTRGLVDLWVNPRGCPERGVDAVDAHQRRMWQVAHPVKSVNRKVSKGHF